MAKEIDVIGLPQSTKEAKFSTYVLRMEVEGTLLTLEYEGIHGLPLRDRVTVNGVFYRLNRRTLKYTDDVNTTLYELRRFTMPNRLSYFREETFIPMIQGLIQRYFFEHTSVVSPASDFARGGSWVARMSWVLEGSPRTPHPFQRQNIRNGTNLASVLWADLSETDDDDEIGFQQAAQVLYDYGIGVTDHGVLFPMDEELDEQEVRFNSVILDDDGVDYDAISIGARYLLPSGETANVIEPFVANEDLVRWVSDTMPTIEQARLEIELQRRRLRQAATSAEFICLYNEKVVPRSVIVRDDNRYLATRVIHTVSSEDVNTTEIEAHLIEEEDA